MHDHAGGLVDHDQMGVFKQNMEGNVLADRGRVDRCRGRDLQFIALGDLERGLAADLIVAAHMTFLDEVLEPRARQVFERLGEHPVEALPGLGGCNRNSFDLRIVFLRQNSRLPVGFGRGS